MEAFVVGIFCAAIFFYIRYEVRKAYGKKHRIRITRANIKNRKWLEEQKEIQLSISENIDRFRRFDCDSFFRGEERAKENWKIYKRRKKRNERRLKFINKLLKS